MKKILIIEDDSFLVEVYANKLEEKGFEIEAARDGEEGLDLLEKKDFDLVVLDISLPGIDGWQVLEKMRSSEKNKETKVIILSNAEVQDLNKLNELKVEKYLIKVNYTSSEVVSEIEEILS
jgi:two-component system, OmpR family, copper resistance phosphate regulon response regulator CusR